MKHHLVICLLFLWMGSSHAQFGIRGQMVRAAIPMPTSTDQSISQLSHSGYDVGIHYWLRLPEHRIEFYPEITYANFSRSEPTSPADRPIDIDRYGLALPISLYPFDFRGDCDCPTFSKQNDLFKKGFFLQLVPSFYQVHSSFTDQPTAKTWKSQAGLAIGAGLDIGISDLVTISPLLHYYIEVLQTKSTSEGPLGEQEFRFGIRVAFRPDYL
ncbi:MAG: hypothetical protein HKN87_24305 [Saprospiraceae bacterium]|nr:hypothetical protein [Saprospiraceae bacterium]